MDWRVREETELLWGQVFGWKLCRYGPLWPSWCITVPHRENARKPLFPYNNSRSNRQIHGLLCFKYQRISLPSLLLFIISFSLHVLHTCSVASVVSYSSTLWTVARQAPLSIGFSWREYWKGLPCFLPGNVLDPGIKPKSPVSPALQADYWTTWEAL